MKDDGSLTNLTNEIKRTFEGVRVPECKILAIGHGIYHVKAMSATILSPSGQYPMVSTNMLP